MLQRRDLYDRAWNIIEKAARDKSQLAVFYSAGSFRTMRAVGEKTAKVFSANNLEFVGIYDGCCDETDLAGDMIFTMESVHREAQKRRVP
jgi:hypothetical protein